MHYISKETHPELGHFSGKVNRRTLQSVKQHFLLHILVFPQEVIYRVHHRASVVLHTKLNFPASLVRTLDVVRVRAQLSVLFVKVTLIRSLPNKCTEHVK